MRSTFKVLFYLKRNKLQPDGKAPIMGRITVNGTIAQFSCKLNIKPDLWDTKAHRAAGKSLEAQKINHALDNIRTQIGKQYQSICDHDAFVSAEKVKNGYLGFGDEYRTLPSIADEFYESYSKRVGKDRTAGSYEQLLINRKRIADFLRFRYKLSDIPVREVEPQFIEDYYAYLLEERRLAGSTLLTAITKLKQIMLIVLRRGYVSVNQVSANTVCKYMKRMGLRSKLSRKWRNVKLSGVHSAHLSQSSRPAIQSRRAGQSLGLGYHIYLYITGIQVSDFGDRPVRP